MYTIYVYREKNKRICLNMFQIPNFYFKTMHSKIE